jgi:hypothetical protein
MKRILLLSSLVVMVLLTSCSKVVISNQEPIVGSWVLTDAAHKDQYGWYTINTGIERGVFTFYNSGRATYTERGVTMEGNWYIRTTGGGYYDEYGDYYTNTHQSLEVHVSDYYGDDAIDMEFDHVRFRGNNFVATNYNNNYIERFTFGRY